MIGVNGVRRYEALMLATGQTTVYAAGDDGDVAAGIAKAYSVLTAGQYSGTANIDVPTYAAATLAFVAATKKITDSANGVALVKTGDVITILGSASNDGTYTVATGNVAGQIEVNEALTNELAGAYVTISKRAAHSNNCVVDQNTKLMWLRDPSNYPAKTGVASDGKLYWTATSCTLHAAGGDLQMVAGGKGAATLKIVGGAGEVSRYHAGHGIVFTGFANAVNNLPGFAVTSVTVNGADLDIVISTGNRTCIAEAAAGARTISVPCNGIFSFVKAANLASVGGYSDWRAANIKEMQALQDGAITGYTPNSTAYPNWPVLQVWSSSATGTGDVGNSWYVRHANTANMLLGARAANTTAYYTMLVRGGL